MNPCPNCAELAVKNEALRKQNGELADALRAQVSRHSNTDMILGAALAGGDTTALADLLAEREGRARGGELR